MKRHLCFIAALGICFMLLNANARAQQVKAEFGALAIGGNVSGSTIVVGLSQQKVDELVRDARRPLEELTVQQRENIALLKEKLDLNERQVRAALSILGENDIPPERLAAKLLEIAERLKALQEAALAQPGDTPKIASFKADAKKALDAGDLAKADALLADVQTEERRALERLVFNSAETSARRGDIALTRLRYMEAAQHFNDAASTFPPNGSYEQMRRRYLAREASALYLQGRDFGDKDALRSSIVHLKTLLQMTPRGTARDEWVSVQDHLGRALLTLGQREPETTRLEEAVSAYREALKEQSREREPLEWARAQTNLGRALDSLGRRESGTANLEEAVVAYREGLKEQTCERAPLEWATTQNSLGVALATLGWRDTGTAKLEQAIIALREALKERTRERVPLDWATTQSNLATVLLQVGWHDSGTANLEEAVISFREALKELTRERAPLDWAESLGRQGVALMLLAERRKDSAMAKTALSQINTAFETMRGGGDAASAAYYEQQLPMARAIVARLGKARSAR